MGEARALYNIGNVFHAKGKQQLWGCTQEPGELPLDVRETLQKATGFYEWAIISYLFAKETKQTDKWVSIGGFKSIPSVKLVNLYICQRETMLIQDSEIATLKWLRINSKHVF